MSSLNDILESFEERILSLPYNRPNPLPQDYLPMLLVNDFSNGFYNDKPHNSGSVDPALYQLSTYQAMGMTQFPSLDNPISNSPVDFLGKPINLNKQQVALPINLTSQGGSLLQVFRVTHTINVILINIALFYAERHLLV